MTLLENGSNAPAFYDYFTFVFTLINSLPLFRRPGRTSGNELDGRQANTAERQETENVYHVDARGGGGISSE